MCKRYSASNPDLSVIGAELGCAFDEGWQPRFNIAPSQSAPVILRQQDGGIRLHHFQWGLASPGTPLPDEGHYFVNATSEDLDSHLISRPSYEVRRCLVVADSFYEWLRVTTPTQPLRFILKGETLPMVFAGLWYAWNGHHDEDGPLNTFAICTTTGNDLVGQIHNRMPVILASRHWRSWLGAGPVPKHELAAMVRPFNADAMDCYRVTPQNNDPAFDDCLAHERHYWTRNDPQASNRIAVSRGNSGMP